jgi:hypothetical protein
MVCELYDVHFQKRHWRYHPVPLENLYEVREDLSLWENPEGRVGEFDAAVLIFTAEMAEWREDWDFALQGWQKLRAFGSWFEQELAQSHKLLYFRVFSLCLLGPIEMVSPVLEFGRFSSVPPERTLEEEEELGMEEGLGLAFGRRILSSGRVSTG